MAIYVIGQAEAPVKTNVEQHPDAQVQSLQYGTSSELTGATLVTANQGTVVCAPGSMACNAAMTEFYQYDGTTDAWVLVEGL